MGVSCMSPRTAAADRHASISLPISRALVWLDSVPRCQHNARHALGETTRDRLVASSSNLLSGLVQRRGGAISLCTLAGPPLDARDSAQGRALIHTRTRMNIVSARHAGLAAVLLGCISVAAPAVAQQAHQHQHGQATAAVGQVQLDAGKKWATDASLRSGMAAIRNAFDADHPAIHAGTQTDAQYDSLADVIQAQVNSIVANCHLPAEADANLHYLIADLSQGVVLMKGQDPARTRHDGAALVHGALNAYGTYFDDPDWVAEPAMKH